MLIAGRAEEQQSLGALLTTPSWRILLGSAGAGKTTLLKWLAAQAVNQGMSTHVVRPVEIEASIALSTLSELVSRVSPSIRKCLSQPHQEVLNDLVVSNPVDDPGLVRAATTALLTALAHDGPILLLLDDAHWIDQQSAEALSFAIRRSLRGHAIVASFRTSERSLLLDALESDDAELMLLSKLSDSAVAEIIESESGLTPSLRIGLARYAEGNPLRARELGRAASRGAEVLFTAHSLSAFSNPLVSAARMFSLTQCEVLYVAAQLRDPNVELLSKIFAHDQVRAALVASADAGQSVTVEGRVQFDHPLFGDAVASLLTADQRRALHGRIALCVEDLVERGRHLSLSSAAMDQATRIEVFVASTHAASQGSITLALQLAFRAVDGVPIPDLAQSSGETLMYVSSQRWLANLEFRLDDPDAAAHRLRTLFERLPQGEHKIRVALDLAALLSWSKTLSVGVEMYQSVLEQEGVPDASVAEAGMQLAMLQINAQTIHQALTSAQRGAAAGHRSGGQVEVESVTIDVFTRFLHGDGFDLRALQKATANEDLQNWLSVQCPPFSLGPFLYAWCQDGRALHQFELRRRVFRARGSSTALAMGLPFEVNMLCSRGHVGQARDLVQLGVAIAEFDNELTRSLSHLAAARFSAQVGDVVGAENSLDIAEASFTKLEFKLGSIEAANVRMSMLSSCSDWSAVLQLGNHWLEELSRCGFGEPALIPGLLDLIEAAAYLPDQGHGNLTSLDSLICRLRDAKDADRPDLVVTRRWAAAQQSARNRHNSESTRQLFESAIDGFVDQGHLFWVARARLAMGRFERREGARRTASDLFRLALEDFTTCEASQWCSIVRSEDKRLAGRTNEGELTTIESQVAQIAASGRSNKEIAAELFISPKTVESHLSSAYRKLGINRRTQLSSRLGL